MAKKQLKTWDVCFFLGLVLSKQINLYPDKVLSDAQSSKLLLFYPITVI